jgi:hypothetical protein
VIQQPGLKLEPTKGTGEFLVIDHVERPFYLRGAVSTLRDYTEE